MSKEVNVEAAIGMVLGHDLTKIVPGQFKGRAFKKGHVISRDDIPELLRIGKEHIYIMEVKPGQLHEDDAVLRLAQALYGPHTEHNSAPVEGKIDIVASSDGLFKIKKSAMYDITACSEISVASLHNNTPVKKGQQLAGARVVPLIIGENAVHEVEITAARYAPIMEVKPYLYHQVGIITTGSEIYTRRIEDRFTPVVMQKLSKYPSSILRHVIVNDCKEDITRVILELYHLGAQMIIVTGGMSVDPDDRTPAAIRDTGAEIITYGTPVLPGSMLMLAYLGGTMPVLGLPGCVMYNRTTVFDLVLPRLFAEERMGRRDFTEMSVGGLCGNCDDCRFPDCGFGKA